MVPPTGEVCGPDNSSTIITQYTFVVDIPRNKKCTRAIFLLRSSAIGLIYNGVPIASGIFFVSSFHHAFFRIIL